MNASTCTAKRVSLGAAGLTLLALGLFIAQPPSATLFELGASPRQPLSPLSVPTDGCDDWPSTEPEGPSETLSAKVPSWMCSGGQHIELMSKSRADLAGERFSSAECKEWCLQHGQTDGHGWCCEWRIAQDGGQCAWSDGAPQRARVSCPVPAEKGSSSSSGCTSQSLAFGHCLTSTRYKRFGGGRCVFHAGVVIARLTAETREHCARRCDAQAQHAESDELACKVFAYAKENYYFRSPHVRRCILLSRCKVRPRESRIFNFFATPEGIPDVPALT